MFGKWLVIDISEAGRLGSAQLFDKFQDMLIFWLKISG